MKKKIIAFISYSRKDVKVADDIRSRLERYEYPKEWVAISDRPDDEKYVRKIYLDVTDLSVTTRKFSDEIKENLSSSRYLIVICSRNSAKSDFVKKEIDYFLQTHNHNADLICAVYVDDIFNGMHEVIDQIVASRNCPIYITDKGKAGSVGRDYCFFHILEFLLKIDFYRLYNRYEEFERRKKRNRTVWAVSIMTLVLGLLVFGLLSEHKRAVIEHARVEFEMAIFPYSLVVGYVDNFLIPTLDALNDSCGEGVAQMIVMMPEDSVDLNDKERIDKYNNCIQARPSFQGFSTEHIPIPGSDRGASITRMNFSNSHLALYKDDGKTVKAFKSVIEYKLSDENPVQVPFDEPRNYLTEKYTDSFIKFTKNQLGAYASQVHLVKSTASLDSLLDVLLKESSVDR